LHNSAAAAVPRDDDDGGGGAYDGDDDGGVGEASLRLWHDLPAMVEFVGEIVLSCQRLLRGKARYRRQDLWYLIEDAGVRALPVVSLISFLVGTILAYMGAVQLALFGAEIYIADLVGLGMVREVGALMTGIILAGRTGAAYAAQLGTMQVNEEIDAFLACIRTI
jgi:phospholipid/cholesterol/gamma-HCH transport system permease protein